MCIRRLPVALTLAGSLLALSGCGDDSAGDAGYDSAFDANEYRPPYDAGRTGPWTSEWRHEARIEVHDDSPCEPWEPVASPLVRGLPADPTPRVLWRFRPDSRLGSRVEAPVVSPDGTIWVRGPSYNKVMQIKRDGTLRNRYLAGGAPPDDEYDRSRLGPIAVAPNGHLIRLVVVEGWGGFRQTGSLGRVDPTRPSNESTAGVSLPEATWYTSPIAIGPDGMVYVSVRKQIFATCRAERLMWTLTNESAPGEEDVFGSGSISNIWVDQDGSLLVSGGMQRLLRVRDGVLTAEEVPNEGVDRGAFRHLRYWTPDVRLFNLFDPPVEDGSYEWLAQNTEADPVVFSTRSSVRLSPTGQLWVSSGMGVAPWPYPYNSGPNGIDYTAGPQPWAWFEDGSWLVSGTTMSRQRYDTESESALVDWTLDLTDGSMSLKYGYRNNCEPVIDATGVAYFASGTELVAVQLDGLPPPPDQCVNDEGCNAQRDRYVRPLAE